MPLKDGVYISEQPKASLGDDIFSLTDAEELMPGITKRVQILLETQTLRKFDGVTASIKKDLDQSGLKPTSIGIGGGEVTSSIVTLHEGLRLSDLFTTVGIYLAANEYQKPKGPEGKFTQWGTPYSGKRKNRVIA